MSIQSIKEISIRSHSLSLKIGFPRRSFARMPHRPGVDGRRHVAGKAQHNLWRSIPWFRPTTIRNYHQHLEHLEVQLHPATWSILCLWGIVCTGPTGPSRRLPHLAYTGASSQRCSELLCVSGIRYTLLPPPHQHIASVEVHSVDSTGVRHTPSVPAKSLLMRNEVNGRK